MKFGLFAKATVVTAIVICGGAPVVVASPSAGVAPTSRAAGVWDLLARCESGGNWAANTGNGYYGGLQFNPRTWAAHGGNRFSRYPHRASREQQIAIAESLRSARSGFGAWPGCARRLGLPR